MPKATTYTDDVYGVRFKRESLKKLTAAANPGDYLLITLGFPGQSEKNAYVLARVISVDPSRKSFLLGDYTGNMVVQTAKGKRYHIVHKEVFVSDKLSSDLWDEYHRYMSFDYPKEHYFDLALTDDPVEIKQYAETVLAFNARQEQQIEARKREAEEWRRQEEEQQRWRNSPEGKAAIAREAERAAAEENRKRQEANEVLRKLFKD